MIMWPDTINLAWALPVDVETLPACLEPYAKTQAIIDMFRTCVQKSTSALGQIPTEIIDIISDEVHQRVYEDVYPFWSVGHRCCTEFYSPLDENDWEQLNQAWEVEFCALYKKEIPDETKWVEKTYKEKKSEWLHKKATEEQQRHKDYHFMRKLRHAFIVECGTRFAEIFTDAFGLQVHFNVDRLYQDMRHDPELVRDNYWCKETPALARADISAFIILPLTGCDVISSQGYNRASFSVMQYVDFSKLRPLTEEKRDQFYKAVKSIKAKMLPDFELPDYSDTEDSMISETDDSTFSETEDSIISKTEERSAEGEICIPAITGSG